MDNIPFEAIRQIYSYDPTYKYIICKVLISLNIHCLIYRCSECYKPYNQCVCYCQTCRTYLRLCKQLYFKDGDMTEADLEDIVGLGVNKLYVFVQIILRCIIYDGRNKLKIDDGN